MEAKGNRKRNAAICIAAAVALAIACVAMINCSAESGLRSNGAQASELAAETRSSGSAEASSDASDVEDATDGAPAGDPNPQSEPISASPGKTTSQDAVSGASRGDSQTYPSAGEAAPTPAPEASGGEPQKQPIWIPDFEDVWVEDSPAWDESVPIHGYTEVSICNICGADITGNTAAHGKQHMLAGEGSGHHSEVRDAVVGYETVHHGAEGHWERVESGGHWE